MNKLLWNFCSFNINSKYNYKKSNTHTCDQGRKEIKFLWTFTSFRIA